jgi:hypothetical protein
MTPKVPSMTLELLVLTYYKFPLILTLTIQTNCENNCLMKLRNYNISHTSEAS